MSGSLRVKAGLQVLTLWVLLPLWFCRFSIVFDSWIYFSINLLSGFVSFSPSAALILTEAKDCRSSLTILKNPFLRFFSKYLLWFSAVFSFISWLYHVSSLIYRLLLYELTLWEFLQRNFGEESVRNAKLLVIGKWKKDNHWDLRVKLGVY